jgi:hypothetical protein
MTSNTTTQHSPSPSVSSDDHAAAGIATTTHFFAQNAFEAAARAAIGKAAVGTSDIGLVFAVLERVTDGDFASWNREWTAAADELRRQAEASRSAGRYRTAGRFFLAASDYYSRALFFIDGMTDQSSLLPTFRLAQQCWDGFIASSEGLFLPIEVPYEGDSMPGYLLRPDVSGAARPTLVITNGSDGSLAGLWAEGIQSQLERGWNVFVFDGPGQQSMLFERDVPFRYDWEAALTPVVDLLVERPDVRTDALFAYGVSQGGYWLPRALAFEHRFVAAFLDGGVMDVSESWYSNLPRELLEVLKSGDRDLFNKYMGMGAPDPIVERELAFRARPYGKFDTPYDLFTAVGKFRLDDVIGQITTPTLVADPDNEQFFEGQRRRVFDALRCEKELARFTAAEGADHHCQPLARELTALRMNDFFDRYLPVGA